VREVHVPNRPAADPDGAASRFKGLPPEAVAHFQAKYPRDSWNLPQTAPILAVGPAVFSRSAISLLEADAAAPDSAAAAGDSVTLLADAGKATFVISQKYSPEVQAVIVEMLSASGAFLVKGIDDAAGLDLYRGTLQYTHLHQQKVQFFVESNLTATGVAAEPYQVYLRLIDTRTGVVVCAVSQAARDVRAAARAAAGRLVSQVVPAP